MQCCKFWTRVSGSLEIRANFLVQEEYHLIEKRCEQVQICYGIIEKYAVETPPTDLAHYKTLDPAMQRLKQAFTSSMDSRMDSVQWLSNELDKSMLDVSARSISLRNRLQDPVLLDVTTAQSVAMQLLDDLDIDIGALEKVCASYVKHQKQFDLTSNDSIDLVEARREFIERRQVWLSVGPSQP